MAFGGGSGFSFGSNNNNQSSGFGGFGNSTNTNTGFGANTGTTGFGSSTTAANPFGGGTTSTFGSNTGGFGTNNNNAGSSLFGANKSTSSPFGGGSSSSTGLFGGTANTAPATGGFGGFGSNTNTGTGGFGSSTTAGTGGFGGFGGATANKPAFGSSTTTTTPLFGQNGAGTTGGFGSSTTGAFGSSGSGTALNQPVPVSDGTASTPFAPTIEKETNGTTNSFQSITFQQPYQKYSFEELRLADYNAGRRFGNGSGQAGAFGSSSFGGFGSSNTGGAFGSTNTNSNPFGTTAATSSGGFGSTTATSGFGGGGGLFGNTANKPGGLFGTATSAPATTGGLFGSASNNTGGFGGGTTNAFGGNTNAGGGGLFGSTAAKPGGLFGNTGSTAPSTGGGFSFGNNTAQSTTNTGGGLFGNNTGTASTGGLFGNNQTQQPATGGLFGNTGNQAKPGGLFGSTGGFGTSTTQSAPSGGLFGTSNTNNSSGGGLFGTNTNNNSNTGGGLFGNNSSTGGGLFGNNSNTANNTTGGLFGSNNNANNPAKPGGLFGTSNTGGGLFGSNATTANNSGGMFTSNASNNTGGGLFGNTANKQGNSLFGNQSTTQPSGGLFAMNNSSNPFGASQSNQQNQQQQDQFKHSSLLDPNPYGQSSIWTGLPAPTPENAKPVFTPLTATQKMKESMMKPPPSLRLNQSRYMTPPRRNGFGFSYSNYGTPNSAASTPGGASLSGSMYGSRGWSGGSFGRSFTKSASVQNLRAQFTADGDDIWKPGAFASAHRNSGGSIKRLTIDRSIRNDLFSRPTQPALPAPEKPHANSTNGASSSGQGQGDAQPDPSHKLKKRVSFDSNTSNGQLNGQTGALIRTETDENDHDNQPVPEGRPHNGAGHSSRNKELAAVPEDRESDHVTPRPAPPIQAKNDPKPGDYWMRPSRAEMSKMPRERLQNFKDFQVGRYGCGQVTFNGTVDLTSLPIDELYDKIVEIRLRSITVYPDAAMKPPVGKGLNVPSTIAIENSWPRSRNQPSSATSGPVFDKHIERLNKIPGTEFVDYEVTTGVWTFRVPHYTRYGLDYDDDDEDMSELSPPPDTIEKSMAEDSVMEVDADDYENSSTDEDDTFAFKQKTVPGGFGKRSAVDYELYPADVAPTMDDTNKDDSEQSAYSEDEMSDDEPSMAGSFPAPALSFDSPIKPALKPQGTPGRPLLDLEGDWADQLQRTISPRKQNRDTLRDVQSKVLLDKAYSPIKPKQNISRTSFRNSVDIMSSIFGQHETGRKSSATSSGSARKQMQDETDFEFPYAKRAKTFDSNLDEMRKEDRTWLQSFRTHFTGTGELILRKRSSNNVDDILLGEDDYVVVKSRLANEEATLDVTSLLASAEVIIDQHIPYIQHQNLAFSFLADQLNLTQAPDASLTSDVYTLAHILFDDYEDKYTLNLQVETARRREQVNRLILRDRLSDFLTSTIYKKHADRISKIEHENHTAAAVLKLTYHDIKGACDSLEKAGNFRLMVLVSQLENTGPEWQADVKAQIDAWREQGLLSEMTEDVRALYEICAGNVTICQGRSAAVTPVEDRAKTFAISEEYNLDWLQCFALGYWYGGEEMKFVDPSEVHGNVSVEDAVVLFSGRCDRGEEIEKPRDDPLWTLLQLFASLRESKGIQAPILPQALTSLCKDWDVGPAFKLYHAIVAHVDDVVVDTEKADELAALFAFQLSSQGDLLGAIAALLHLNDASKRAEMIQTLLERFAAQLPEPNSTTSTTSEANGSKDLWTQLTSSLQIPKSWIYTAQALHARAVQLDPHAELKLLILAQSWDAAHECLIHRVAPACIVDAEYDTLAEVTDLFGTDAEQRVGEWIIGGSVYADFVQLVQHKGKAKKDFGLVHSLKDRLVDMDKQFHKGDHDKDVQLGKLSIEELEERVAIKEMAKVVAEFMDSAKEILDLPVTSDQRLTATMAMAGEYYRAVMAGGKA